jgi:hypothetical protein
MSWLPHYHRSRLTKNNKRLLNDHIQRMELDWAVTLQSVSATPLGIVKAA